MSENEILGFDPSQLNVFNQVNQSKETNSLIYHPRPQDSKSEDGCYRSTIKVIYNPFDLQSSVVEQQSYAIEDSQGWLTVVSSLTNNDKSCPIFTAWKKCRYSDPSSPLYLQALSKDKGGKGLFDKRFSRYVTIQVMEDKNHPELVGKYMLWKIPGFVWDAIEGKMHPAAESNKAPIPVMDFLFGRAIYLTVTPGPGKPGDARYSRETSYSKSEIAEVTSSCTNPDGTPLLTPEEKLICDKYVSAMNEVWISRDPEFRAQRMAAINSDPNTALLKDIYKKVIENIKGFCPNVAEEMAYKEWPQNVKDRVQAWIDIVLSGNDPKTVGTTLNNTTAAAIESLGNDPLAPTAQAPAAPAPTPAANSFVSSSSQDDDLPF